MPTPARLALLALALAGPAAAAEPAGKSLFDGKTLSGWKPSNFYGNGKVSVKDGAIVLPRGKKMTGVTYAGKDFPKLDYEVSFEAKKVEGNDFFATATFPVGDSFCSLVVGGWGGEVVGLSNVDSSDASSNETRTDVEFATGRWYRIRIRVTGNRIAAWIDKKKVVDLDTTDRRLGIRIECNASKPFGICTYDTVALVRDVRLVRLKKGGPR